MKTNSVRVLFLAAVAVVSTACSPSSSDGETGDDQNVTGANGSDSSPVDASEIFAPDALTFGAPQLKMVRESLCVPAEEMNRVGEQTKALIKIYEDTDLRNATPDGKINDRERKVLIAMVACPLDKVQNAFERQTFRDGGGSMAVMTKLLNKLPDDSLPNRGIIAETTRLNEVRARIRQVRAQVAKDPALKAKVAELPEPMRGQWTRDLAEVLVDLPAPSQTE